MSGALDLAKELGLTNDDLVERVVAKCVDRVMESAGYDEDGESEAVPSTFARKLHDAVKKRIDAAVEKIAAKHVLPNVTTYLEQLELKATNQWGEARGPAVTFVEYLVQRAEHYMTEKVDHSGKAKDDAGNYGSWSGSQTRIAYLIHQHLQYSIETAMKQVLKDGNAILIEGLEKTCKAKLEEIAKQLKVEVKTR